MTICASGNIRAIAGVWNSAPYEPALVPDTTSLIVRVTVVEAAPRLLGMFGPASSERARRTLERRGVVVRLGVGVYRVSAVGTGVEPVTDLVTVIAEE